MQMCARVRYVTQKQRHILYLSKFRFMYVESTVRPCLVMSLMQSTHSFHSKEEV